MCTCIECKNYEPKNNELLPEFIYVEEEKIYNSLFLKKFELELFGNLFLVEGISIINNAKRIGDYKRRIRNSARFDLGITHESKVHQYMLYGNESDKDGFLKFLVVRHPSVVRELW